MHYGVLTDLSRFISEQRSQAPLKVIRCMFQIGPQSLLLCAYSWLARDTTNSKAAGA